MFTTSIVPAKKLMADDRFKMGGLMYQINDTSRNDYGDQIIWARPVESRSHCVTIIVGRNASFKIYNQA